MHIEFTLSTLPLLLLTALLWRRAQGKLLPVVMFMSVFQAASVVNISIGGTQLGIGASYLLLLMAISKQIGAPKQRGYALHKPRRSTAILISLFAAYACASVFVYPWLFKGVYINNPKFGSSLVPLEWSPTFLPQLIYLVVSVSLYFVAAYRTTPAELSKSLDWYVGGAVLASCVAIYQYASMKTGLPFPTELLHSNPVYTIYDAYEINGFPRMDATFTEASAAAFSFATALSLGLWNLLSKRITLLALTINLLLLSGLLLTISTTGYICLAFIGAIAVWLYLSKWRGTAQQRSSKLLLAVPALASILIAAAVPSVQVSLDSLMHTVILDKTQTSSYEMRSRSNDDAYRTGAQTHWLGAGWGVCRGSSIVPTVLGNVGLPGFLLLTAFAVQPFLVIFSTRGVSGPIHGAVLFALATIFLDLIVSGPDLTAPILWLLLAIAARLSRIKLGGLHRRSVYLPEGLSLLHSTQPQALRMRAAKNRIGSFGECRL